MAEADEEQQSAPSGAPSRFSDAQVAEAKAKSKTGEVHFLSVDDLELEFLVRPPTSGEYKRYKALALDPDVGKRAGALEQLFRDCCLLPEPLELQQLLGKYPALAEDLGVECRRIAGGLQEVRAKKL